MAFRQSCTLSVQLVSSLTWAVANSEPVAVSTAVKVTLAFSVSGRGPANPLATGLKEVFPLPPVHQWLPDCRSKELPGHMWNIHGRHLLFPPRNREDPAFGDCPHAFCPCIMQVPGKPSHTQ